MKILIAGASGLIGHALVAALRERGDDVLRLVRRPSQAPDEIAWRPEANELDPAKIEGVDVVVNLAGENIAGGRWTASRRSRIVDSRVNATRTLVTTCARLQRKPSVFINASAVGYYGDAGDADLTEESPPGLGFLPETCLIWETNAEGVARAGIRTAILRFGVVLASDGGALAKMLPIFRLGFGGPLGRGTQWMSWVALDDVVGVAMHVIDHPQCVGAFNVVSPEPVTNGGFTAMLARVLKRPAIFPVPGWALRLLFGQMAVDTILASTRVLPSRLQAAGYGFKYRSLELALRAILGR